MHSLVLLVALCIISEVSCSFFGLGSLFGRGFNTKHGVDPEAEFSVGSGDMEHRKEDEMPDSVCLFASGRRKLHVRGIMDDDSDCVADRLDETHLRMDDISDFAPLQVMCEVNGYTVPAIIDTGAQISIMSYSCAKRCRINNNIDTRYAGRAIGVGSSDILGRINGLNMKIGPISFDGKVSILRDSRVDFLIGLDFLKRFNCEVSFKDRALRLQVRDKFYKIPLISDFYNENQHLEIPASKMDFNEYNDDDYDSLGPTGATEHGYSDGEEFGSADLTRVDGTYSDIESDVDSDSGSGSGSGMRTLSSCGTRRSDGCGHNEGVRSVDEIIASVKRETEQKAAHEGKQQKRQIMRRQRQRQPRHLREGDEQEEHESESPDASPLPQPEFDLSGI